MGYHCLCSHQGGYHFLSPPAHPVQTLSAHLNLDLFLLGLRIKKCYLLQQGGTLLSGQNLWGLLNDLSPCLFWVWAHEHLKVPQNS